MPVLAPLSVVVYSKASVISMDAAGWGALAFLAFVNSLLGFFSWNRALALGGIQRISQLQLLQPFITYAYSVAFMHESFDWLTLSVCAVVIVLVAISRSTLLTRRPAVPRHKPVSGKA